jgi:hypothetical protein
MWRDGGRRDLCLRALRAEPALAAGALVIARTTKRATRAPPRGRHATPRDLVGLQLVAAAQPVSTAQYATYLQMSLPIARRSLRKLRDLALVAVHVPSMEAASLYTLTRMGALELARISDTDVDAFRVPGDLTRVSFHHRDVVDVYVALTRALGQMQGRLLERFAFEDELRGRVGTVRNALIPDAVAVLAETSGERRAYALEVDRGGEVPAYVVARKLVPYAELAAARMPLLGVTPWRVLVTVPTRRRLHRLVLAGWEAGIPEDLFFFAVAETLTPSTIARPIWETPRLDASGKQAVLATASPFTGGRADCSLGCTIPVGENHNDGEDLRDLENGSSAPRGAP